MVVGCRRTPALNQPGDHEFARISQVIIWAGSADSGSDGRGGLVSIANISALLARHSCCFEPRVPLDRASGSPIREVVAVTAPHLNRSRLVTTAE
jgi:hypothetical protein